MRLPVFIPLFLLLAGGAIDLYLYKVLRRRYGRKVFCRLHMIVAVAFAMVMIAVCFMPVRSGSDGTLRAIMWMLYSFLSVYVPKIVFCVFDWLSLAPVIWHKRPLSWLSWTGVVSAVVVFALLWWGAIVNRFNVRVNRVNVVVKDLPAAFEGMTIAQISDLHVGTFGSDTGFVGMLVDSVNSLHADMIVFTGDIVNRRSDELLPFVQVLSRLHAPMGVYSIMGNHDYGDYEDWPDDDAKRRNLSQLQILQARMGWHMLNNESVMLRRGDSGLVLVGVENVGDPPFHTYGDLDRAYATPSDSLVKILLTHNPAHWENDIAGNVRYNYALTLSGHTHAMQIELFGLSPAVWRYNTWGGLYHDKLGRSLYVNIGAGTVGMPARIGAVPEITLLRLSRE